MFAFLFVFAPSSIQSCCCFSLSLVVGSIVLQKKEQKQREREKRVKKSKKREETVLTKCAIIFSWVRNFRRCSGKCCISTWCKDLQIFLVHLVCIDWISALALPFYPTQIHLETVSFLPFIRPSTPDLLLPHSRQGIIRIWVSKKVS